jgi:hypothetical protein
MVGNRQGVYFHVPGNYQVLEEILTEKSNKSNKFQYKALFSLPFSLSSTLRLIFFSKYAAFKVNDVILGKQEVQHE